MVHYSTKYGSFDEALQQPNGIAVIAFLFKVMYGLLHVHETQV